MLESLSIVTITYNNPEDLLNTYNSLESFRKAGGQHIIVNGGSTIKALIDDDCVLLEEPDRGIYDALNKGIILVKTDYFMLIHSGDSLVAPNLILKNQLSFMRLRNLDILLNSCTIQFGKKKRLMSSRLWRPWMFNIGAQPPHPPIIYKTQSVEQYKYLVKHTVIADFAYLKKLFIDKLKYDQGDQILVHMTAGGKTSSGLTSFLLVNKEFYAMCGAFKALIYILFRPMIKVIQMIY